MAKKWVEVAASPEFNALAPQQQEEARQQYWREVVAPNVPQDQLQAMQSEFDADTKPTIANPSAQPLDVDITGGQSVPAADYAQMRQQEGAQVPVASPSLGQEIGLGARTLLQGAGGLLGAVGGDALNHFVINPALRAVGLGNQQALPYRDEAAGLADKLGLPRPQGAQQRVLNDVGEALTGTGLTMGLGSLLSGGATAAPSAASKLGDLLSGQPVRQVIGTVGGATGSSVARESGADEKTQMLAGLAGGLGPDLLGTGGAAAVRGLVRGRNGDAMSQTIKDFESVGATPSVGQASGNRAIQGVESLLSGAPTSTGVMSRFAEKQAEDIGAGLGRMADNLSRNASGERAGRAIESGVQTFNNNVGAMRRALYWQADQFIPSNTPMPLSNTQQALGVLITPNPGAAATTGALVNPKIQQMAQNLSADLQANGGAIPYAAVKDLRSRIGEALSDYSLTPDSTTREYRKLYAALSQDLEQAAKGMGQDAERAAKRANNYTKYSSARLEQIERVVDKNGGPEKVFNAAMQGTRDGGTTLHAVMQSLPPDGQKAVTAAVIKRMGMATPGAQDAAGDVFSAATFMTNWNRVSPEAKRALFDRYGPSFSKNMDQIARVANNIKQGSRVYANPSGTANKAAAYTYGASLVASMFDPTLISTGSLIVGGIGANGVARYLTDPRAVRWLAKATEMPRHALVVNARMLAQSANKAGDENMMQLAQDVENAIGNSGPAEDNGRNK